MATTQAELRDIGFQGFVRFADLRASTVPSTQGVYAVLRCTQGLPEFLPRNPAGAIRGDPSVSPQALTAAWVNGVEVVYFGKASRLRRGLEEYRRHGLGGRARHWGGRYIWQLADAGELLVAWRDHPGDGPSERRGRPHPQVRRGHRPASFANRNLGGRLAT